MILALGIIIASIGGYSIATGHLFNSKQKTVPETTNNTSGGSALYYIRSFNSSLYNFEVTSQNEMHGPSQWPNLSLSIHAKDPVACQIAVRTPEGSDTVLLSEKVVGNVTISYPSTVSQQLDFYLGIFTIPGNYTFNAQLFNGTGVMERNLTVNVNNALSVVAISGPPAGEINTSYLYQTGDVSGGVGNYNFTWNVFGIGGFLSFQNFSVYGKNLNLDLNQTFSGFLQLTVTDSLISTRFSR